MKNILDIVYNRYYDLDGNAITLGGIQTYITNLSRLATRINLKVRIFQYTNISFQKQISPDITLIGIPIKENKRDPNTLFRYIQKTRDNHCHYISIFATDQIIPSFRVPCSIAIQHGICWDIESIKRRSLLRSFISKAVSSYKIVKRLQNVEDVVCVDNNFICWYRTQIHERNINLIPILNFSEIAPIRSEEKSDSQNIKIVFARRFFPYRGTRLFADAIEKILSKYDNVYVTFAGSGPDEKYLKDRFADKKVVSFTQYAAEDSLSFHSQFDIAVVPTTGSEGTSLSLLEAMSAQCAVICTNVGGMTNIIIDGYNGLMITPNVNDLYNGLEKLIKDRQYRQCLASEGYKTVASSFSIEKWENKWEKVLCKKML